MVSPHLTKGIRGRHVGHGKGRAMISCQLSTHMGARRLSQTRLAQLAGSGGASQYHP